MEQWVEDGIKIKWNLLFIQVRQQAIDTLVEIYRHVGEKVRGDIAKRDLPEAKWEKKMNFQLNWTFYFYMIVPISDWNNFTKSSMMLLQVDEWLSDPQTRQHRTGHLLLPIVSEWNRIKIKHTSFWLFSMCDVQRFDRIRFCCHFSMIEGRKAERRRSSRVFIGKYAQSTKINWWSSMKKNRW